MEQRIDLLEEYNDKLSHVYDEATHRPEFDWQVPNEVNKMLSVYAKPKCKVLDVGIGTGQSAQLFYQAGCDITGIDISQAMLDIVQQKLPGAHLYKTNIEKNIPDLPKESFDIIVAVGVFEFVENLQKAIKRLSSLLKPSGKFCFTFEEYLPEHGLQNAQTAELGKGIKDPVPQSVSFYVYRRSLDEVSNILKDEDFKILGQKQFVAYFKTDKKIPVIYRIVLAEKS